LAVPTARILRGANKVFGWVGPFLHDTEKDYNGVKLSTRKIFSAYLLCMKGDASMEDEDVTNRDAMDVGASISRAFIKA
jgi:hypothetical protein